MNEARQDWLTLLKRNNSGTNLYVAAENLMHMATSKTKRNTKKNKLGVKNSLVNNINARKMKGVSRPKSKKTVSKKSYGKMKNKWGKKS